MDCLHIAIAEDNPLDVMHVRTVLAELGLHCTLTVVTDGEETRDFILKQGRYTTSAPAHLILLDMHMPKLSGLEVLREIPGSTELPICILTSSEQERREVALHFAPTEVNYLTKPLNGNQLLECLRFHSHLIPVAEKPEENRQKPEC